MKIAGIWSILFLFPQMVFTEIITEMNLIGHTEFMHPTSALENPPVRVGYHIHEGPSSIKWGPDAEVGAEIQISTHIHMTKKIASEGQTICHAI
jgi:hypothetical protein